MTELSKTARASQVKETPKETKVESTEEAIRQIRLNLEAKLYITPDRIAKLLAAYDAATAPKPRYRVLLGPMSERLGIPPAEDAVKKSMAEYFPTLKALIENPNFVPPEGYKFDFEEINRWAKELGFKEPIVVGHVHDEVFIEEGANIQMKDPTFDHPHEDENHLVDFGHTTVHPTDAGA